jgi:3-hydroxyacyl-[acyl-carrier-protein] dehydratase
VRFILIDRLVTVEPGVRAVAEKAFEAGDPVFDDHFPGMPLVPGVLLTEAMLQTAGWLISATIAGARWPLPAMIDRLKFRRLVRPGERVEFEAVLRSRRGDRFDLTTEARTAEGRAVTADVLFHTFAFELAAADRLRLQEWARVTWVTLGGPAGMLPPDANA